MKSSSRPFIIWTFRRSGGTNLGQSLFVNSEFCHVEHEPFNRDRVFGHIINHWRENKDKNYLYEKIDEVLKDKPLIKHCLEIMPDELNDVLLELSIKYGYRHLFLYRETSKSRLLSLNYAMKTNVWGREQLKTRPIDDSIFDENIDIQKLILHEKNSRQEMKRIYQRIIDLGGLPMSVSFEQLYKSDFNYSSMLVKELFLSLIGSIESVTESFLLKTLKGGSQGTNNDYLRFPNSNEFVDEISNLPEFKLNNDCKINYCLDSNLPIEYSSFWKPLHGIKPNQCYAQGVVLSEVDYTIECQDEGAILNKGLVSNNIHSKFPNISKSNKCRFIYGPISCNSRIIIKAL